MVTEQFIRTFYDAINSRDFEKFTSFFSDDAQFNDISSEHVFHGKKEIRGMADSWFKGFPDMKIQISNIIGSGDVFCVEFSLVGTHQGPLEGVRGTIQASGKKVAVPSCDVIRLKNDKIQSLNCYFAATVLLSQIGAMPASLAA